MFVDVKLEHKTYIYIFCFQLFYLIFHNVLECGFNKAFRLVIRSSFVFFKQHLQLGKINDVINSNQSQLLLVKTNEDQTTSRNVLQILA